MTWGVPLLVSYHFAFHTVHGVLKARILKCLPFPSPVDHILSDLSTMTHPFWVALQAWLGFIELDKAVVLVWLDWLVFCEHGFSLSALWCPLAAPTILLGFLLPCAWGISSQLLQQSTAAAPYLGRGVSPYCRRSFLPNPSTWIIWIKVCFLYKWIFNYSCTV